MSAPLPQTAILGAGPIGLDAALAHVDAGLPFTLYEADDHAAGNLRRWGHVRLFTPWDLDVSPRMRDHLGRAGVPVPEGSECPTGSELAGLVLEPVAALPTIQPHLRLGTRVVSVGRKGLLKHEEIGSPGRGTPPFRLLLERGGQELVEEADRVIDCTGVYRHPNFLGDGGIPAVGERQCEPFLTRSIPDFENNPARWDGKTLLVVGAGHSAQTAIVALAEIAAERGIEVLWALRRAQPRWAVDPHDPLAERAALTRRAAAIAQGAEGVEVLAGTVVSRLSSSGERLSVELTTPQGHREVEVDHVLALTGFVGDRSLYDQLQVHECYATAGPMKLSAALLGESSADCMDQTSHGADVLTNPEPDFFILGSKSYGRHTTFLMRVGWEQVDDLMPLLTG